MSGASEVPALLPCPFCGSGSPTLRRSHAHAMSWVSCSQCGLEAPSETGVSGEQAVAYWNTRAARPVDTGREKALEEAAKVADSYKAEFERALPYYGPADKDVGRGRQEGHIHAAENIAAAIRLRALANPENGRG